ETLQKIHNNLGTDVVIVGSFLTIGDQTTGRIRLDVRVQDAVVGETVATLAETGTESQLFELISLAGARLREKLGVGEVSDVSLSAAQASLPANLAAARLYAQGLEKLRRYEAQPARDLFQQAVAEDPQYALAHSALAEAWAQMGHSGKSAEAAKTAYELSENLPNEERLLIEGRYRAAKNEREKAIEIYQKLWEMYPDNVEYGLRLAATQKNAGKRHDAMATIDALRQLPAPESEDARIDLEEAHIAEKLSDFDREKSACEQARAKATAQGAVLLVARAWWFEGRSLYFLNEHDQAMAAFEESKRLYTATGDRDGLANVLNAIGIVQRVRGNREEALKNQEEALAIKRENGQQGGVASLLSNIGIIYQNMGDLSQARKLYEESASILRDLNNKTQLPASLTNLANLLIRQGEFRESKETYGEVIELGREIESTYQVALGLNNLSGVQIDLGELREARENREKALQMFREIGHKFMISYSLKGLGDILKAEGDLAGAQARHDSSLALREELELRIAFNSRLAIADLFLEEGRYEEAESLISESVKKYRAQMSEDDDAMAQALLARAFAGQQKTSKALQAAEWARSLADKSQNIKTRLPVNVHIADVIADDSNSNEEKAIVQKALDKAEITGYVALKYEARLVLGKIELNYGDRSRGRNILENLISAATEDGFHLIAQKAANAIKFTEK
ncbi:tetratricopeptide repeat protein, partial [bacterium]|nr:tetratricopeptide repeat protein [bacterium]